MALGVATSPHHSNRVILVVVSSPEYGMTDNDYLSYDLRQFRMLPKTYSELTVCNNQLCLVAIEETSKGTGMSEEEEGLLLHQYYFDVLLKREE